MIPNRAQEKEVAGAGLSAASVAGGAVEKLTKSPKRKPNHDPYFRPTLIRAETLRTLRKLQKQSTKQINLKFLAEACCRIALQGDHANVVSLAQSLASRDAP